MRLPSILKPSPVSRGLDGTPDDFTRGKALRTIAALSGGVAVALVSLLPLSEQAKRADERAAKQKADEARDREQESRDIWKQPDGNLVIGSTFTIEGDPLRPESASKTFVIQFIQTESGTNMMINGQSYALFAEDEIPIFKKKISASIFVTGVVKSGHSLTVKGEGYAGLKPGESQWIPQSLLLACEQAAVGAKKIPYDITRDNGDMMKGFLERIEKEDELAVAGAQEAK